MFHIFCVFYSSRSDTITGNCQSVVRTLTNWNLANSVSLRASAHTGVAISRIEVPFFDNTQADSVKRYKKNSLYDDGLPGIRWRLPHQRARWFAMTRSDGTTNSQFHDQLMKSDNQNCQFLRQHRIMGQGDSARGFGASESMKNAGILDVFPIFHTAQLGQKIRRSPQLPLCGVALN